MIFIIWFFFPRMMDLSRELEIQNASPVPLNRVKGIEFIPKNMTNLGYDDRFAKNYTENYEKIKRYFEIMDKLALLQHGNLNIRQKEELAIQYLREYSDDSVSINIPSPTNFQKGGLMDDW